MNIVPMYHFLFIACLLSQSTLKMLVSNDLVKRVKLLLQEDYNFRVLALQCFSISSLLFLLGPCL